MYDEIFEMYVWSVLDNSFISSSFGHNRGKQLFMLYDELDEYDAKYLAFKPEMIVHNSTQMQIQLNFEKPENVSTTSFGNDYL